LERSVERLAGGGAAVHRGTQGVPEAGVRRLRKDLPKNGADEVAPARDPLAGAAVEIGEAPLAVEHIDAVGRRFEHGLERETVGRRPLRRLRPPLRRALPHAAGK
jgi:hypothetical protein